MSEPTPVPPVSSAVEIDVAKAARAWLSEDGKVALATVVATWGSAPVPVGGQMAVAVDGRFQGSVSGGCIEGDIITEAAEVLEGGSPRTLEFGVADETAWQAGLPCGGRIKVHVEQISGEAGATLLDKAVAARVQRHALVVRTQLKDGRREVFERTDGAIPPEIDARFRSGQSELVESPDGDVFVHALVPPARVVLVGATHIAQVLSETLKLVGYEIVVVDPRTAYASDQRFSGVRMIAEWPQDAIPALGLDPYTAVVALAHVGHIDDEALKVALRAQCLYIGALGSTRSHAKRTERLKEAGFGDVDIARIRAPIGLDIGAQSPAEIALSIAAEIVLALRGAKRNRASARAAA